MTTVATHASQIARRAAGWVSPLLLLVLLLLGAPDRAEPTTTAAAATARGLRMILRPFTDTQGRSALEVELSFKGSDTGHETLVLPSSWGGQEKLYRGVSDLQALSPNTTLSGTSLPDRKSIECNPGAVVRLRYTVQQDWEKDFSKNIFRPSLSENGFTLIGAGFLVTPEWDPEMRRPVTFRWEIPRNWTQADSFGTGRPSKTRAFTATLSQLQTAVYVGGDYRIRVVSVRERPVTLALRGKWRFTDAQFSDLARRIVSAERRFWKDDSFPAFLITLTPTQEPGKNYLGTGLTNSIAAYADKDVELMAIPGLKQLLAHELFHTWNPLRLSQEGQFPEPQERHSWFGEGFTEYYAHRLLLQSGLVTRNEYVAALNDRIRDYCLSPVRGASNRRVEAEFFTSDAVGRLPYLRGELLALRWNAVIRNSTGGRRSLDDVLYDLRRNAARTPRLRPESAMKTALLKYAKYDISRDIERYVRQGETVPLSADALGTGITLTTKTVAPFDPGLDLQALQEEQRVEGVLTGGSAYQAGLRDGQGPVRSLSFSSSDSSVPVVVVIANGNGGLSTVRYLPKGSPRTIPQYVLRFSR
ncbi:MAG: hypothetical protein H7Z41_11990 [Cytophagales bacterium]|nr:hypothetical protein [Armatimonadota bacterium]